MMNFGLGIIIAAGATAIISYADKENIFGINPEKKWWWERITPTPPVNELRAKLTEEQWAARKWQEQHNLEKALLRAQDAKANLLVKQNTKYTLTG